MKVLKILGLVFGILLLLTGAGLLVASFAAGKGDDAIAESMQQNGLAGPVNGRVTAVDTSVVTVEFVDLSGDSQTADAQTALSNPVEVGDTVSIYYSSDDPSIAFATDLLDGQLSSIASTLRTAGIVCLVVGGLMLAASIVGLVLGRQAAVAAGPGQAYPAQQAYPPQGPAYPPGPGQGYPPQPGQPFPQPGQPYPPQPYAPRPGQPHPAQNHPPQNEPPQNEPPQNEPPQNQPPQNQPTQNYSMPPPTPYPPAQDYGRPGDPGAGGPPKGPPSAR